MSIGILHILFVTRANTIADYLSWEQKQETEKSQKKREFVVLAIDIHDSYLLMTFRMLFGFNVIDLIGSDAQDRCFSRSSSSSDHV